jgi:hypothetical protein
VPATVRERMRALIAEDPEETLLEVLRRLRAKELMVRLEASRNKGQRRRSQLPCGAF